MTRREKNARARKPKGRIILAFGESDNDTHALKFLVAALRPELPLVEPQKVPLILAKDAHKAKRSTTMEKIARYILARRVTHDVLSVIAHRDCDAVEPAHEDNCKALLDDMRALSLPQPVAATPAFEIESWWFLWPDALAATRPCWNKIKALRDVGMIRDAKGELFRRLQPVNGSGRCPDYAESDSRKIAENVKKMALVHKRRGTSRSFENFVEQINGLKI